MTLAERLRAATVPTAHDDLLIGDLVEDSGEATPAAVLVAVTDRPDPGLILTVRREHLRTHAGQVAFPGGRIDPGPKQEMGGMMYGRSVEDPDGHHWEVMWMDAAAAEQGASALQSEEA